LHYPAALRTALAVPQSKPPPGPERGSGPKPPNRPRCREFGLSGGKGEAKGAKNRPFWPNPVFYGAKRQFDKDRQWAPENLHKHLNLHNYFLRGEGNDGGSIGLAICVFFTQQSLEKRRQDLWERCFFIAPQVSSDNVVIATEGGIPVSRCPVYGSHQVRGPRWVNCLRRKLFR
jgi:hypothetical protein